MYATSPYCKRLLFFILEQYFPKTSNSADDISAFKEVFECGLTMIEASPIINTKVQEERLSDLNYRISADYGRVETARSMTSTSDDLFGPTYTSILEYTLEENK